MGKTVGLYVRVQASRGRDPGDSAKRPCEAVLLISYDAYITLTAPITILDLRPTDICKHPTSPLTPRNMAANNITTDFEHRSMACIKQPPHHLTTIQLCTQKIPWIATRRSIHVIQLMQLRCSHSAIIKSTHTYVSARVTYDGLDESSPKTNYPQGNAVQTAVS